MSYVGEFHEVEKDGKLLELVYHHPKYHPIQQTQNITSSVEPLNYEYYFLCPRARLLKDGTLRATAQDSSYNYPLVSPPGYVLSSKRTEEDHHVFPLFWCNNKEFDVNGGCSICKGLNFGTNYYLCDYCDEIYHKECVQSPPIIKHPYHPEHPLQLSFEYLIEEDCLCCGKIVDHLVYYCSTCKIAMHPICAMERIPFVTDPPKTHNHPLTLFLRQSSLICNVCGLLRNIHPTYICARCNFVAHHDCMYSPRIIKISRHPHRISYTSSLRSVERSCGVCRTKVHNDYSAYTCDNCSDYVVHSRCALGKEVWDGEDLECVPQEEDITEDVGPFDIISEGVILYFLHDHHLKLDISIFYDENKLCQACILPIYEGSLYSCMKCDFILHDTCANAPRIIHHALHPHPLILNAVSRHDDGAFYCSACRRKCGGFFYECPIGECDFYIDIRCGIVSEPFDYKGHQHPLFLALDSKVHPLCHVCKSECHKQLNCIQCDFIVCMNCATLPFEVRYKHDTHSLTLICGNEVRAADWCEICEQDLQYQGKLYRFCNLLFYSCKECCTTFHVECLIGEDPYLKPGQFFKLQGQVVQILPKDNISRPLCGHCHDPCQSKIFKRGSDIACSLICMYNIV